VSKCCDDRVIHACETANKKIGYKFDAILLLFFCKKSLSVAVSWVCTSAKVFKLYTV